MDGLRINSKCLNVLRPYQNAYTKLPKLQGGALYQSVAIKILAPFLQIIYSNIKSPSMVKLCSRLPRYSIQNTETLCGEIICIASGVATFSQYCPG